MKIWNDALDLYYNKDLPLIEKEIKLKEMWIESKNSEALRKKMEYHKNKNWFVKDKDKPVIDVWEKIRAERKISKIKIEKKTAEEKVKFLLQENEELIKRNEILEDVRNHKYNENVIRVQDEVRSESTAVLVLSDWHIEETVDAESVNWLNEYNPDIAEIRADKIFYSAVKLIKSFQHETEIKTMIVALLWDFISWYIHEELQESNWLSPTEAILRVKGMISRWLDFILNHTKLELIIPCNFWNHWRTTKDKRNSTAHKNNFEWLMYNILKDEYKNEKRVTFQIANWYFNYVTVYDKVIRFHHWDQINYWWGVWWPTIPINKAIDRFNKWRQATIDVIWHFHQTMDFKNFVANWSLIGTNAYSLKFWFENPSQSLFLINSKYSKTIFTPIFTE